MNLVGIDVGGTNFRLGVYSGTDLLDEKRFEADFSLLCNTKSPVEAQSSIVATISEAIAGALERFPDIAAVGIGFPGFIDPETMRIKSSPNLPNLRDVDIATPLSSRFGIPVVVENDALAAACGEHVLGESSSLIYMGLGTGVGGGLVLNGNPYPGENGVAMEIGHIIVAPGGRTCGCGNCGCLEQYASATGVVKTYFELAGTHLSAKEIAHLAGNGDPESLRAFDLAGKMLGHALSHILKVLDISHVVIGGGLSASWHLMETPFRESLEADLVPVLRGKTQVGVSKARDRAGMLGAARLALKNRNRAEF